MANAYTSKVQGRVSPYFGKLTLKNLFNYSPNLMLWGGASFIGLFVFVEGWPLFQKTFFQKIPVVGDHWVDKTPDEDKPN